MKKEHNDYKVVALNIRGTRLDACTYSCPYPWMDDCPHIISDTGECAWGKSLIPYEWDVVTQRCYNWWGVRNGTCK